LEGEAVTPSTPAPTVSEHDGVAAPSQESAPTRNHAEIWTALREEVPVTADEIGRLYRRELGHVAYLVDNGQHAEAEICVAIARELREGAALLMGKQDARGKAVIPPRGLPLGIARETVKKGDLVTVDMIIGMGADLPPRPRVAEVGWSSACNRYDAAFVTVPDRDLRFAAWVAMPREVVL